MLFGFSVNPATSLHRLLAAQLLMGFFSVFTNNHFFSSLCVSPIMHFLKRSPPLASEMGATMGHLSRLPTSNRFVLEEMP